MKVGVVVTCKNAWDYTRAALASLVSQHELFVVVVDDGSTDGTKAGLEEWGSFQSADETRHAITDPPFASLAGKWNVGVLKCWEAGCDYALVSNNDVLFHPQTIDTLVARLEKGDVAIATGHDVGGIFRERDIPPAFITTDGWTPDPDLPEAESPDFSCFMLSRECWRKVGPFDVRYEPAYFEDNDYHERVLRNGLVAVNLPTAPYYHYGSVTQSQDRTPDPEKHRRFEATREQFYRKWGFVPHGNARLPDRLRLMVVGDGHQPTGFATVVHAILDRLAATGDFDIHHIAINYFGDPAGVPWQMYPAHLSTPPDMFGRGRIAELYDRLKPEAVLLVQDPWHIADYVRTKRGMRGLVSYYPVDSPNLSPSWITYQAAVVEPTTYTKFGAEQSAQAARLSLRMALEAVADQHPGDGEFQINEIMLSGMGGWNDPQLMIPLSRLYELQEPAAYNVVPHGVDTNVFRPMDKRIARRASGLPERHFLVGYVHRNQPRKRQDAMVRAWAKFVKGLRDADVGVHGLEALRDAPLKITDATLVVHAALDSSAGWNLEELVQAYGLNGAVHITDPTQAAGKFSVDALNRLYCSLDVNANLGGGEGWGLSHMESAACGVAQMVPAWSATGEIWGGHAALVPVKEVRHQETRLNTMQAVCDTDAAADQLQQLYDDRRHCENLGEAAFALVSRPEYSWDNVAARFSEIIRRAALRKGVAPRFVTVRKQRVA